MKIQISKEIEEYIKLQRTQLKKNVAEEFKQSLINDHDVIKPFLNDYKKVLDIGCGIAGIDLMLDKKGADFYLFDKSEKPDKIFYNFEEQGCFYNDMSQAKKFLEENHFKGNIYVLDIAKKEGIQDLQEVDLVISLISWGFHYPIKTYVEDVDKMLSDKGIIILDLRKKVFDQEIKAFHDLNYEYEVIKEYAKYTRLLLRKIRRHEELK